MTSVYALPLTILGVCIIGTVFYLLLRIIEVQAPLFVTGAGLCAAFFLVAFCLSPSQQISPSDSTNSVALPCFAIWSLICIVLGARFHRPLRADYGFLFNCFLVAAANTSSIIFIAAIRGNLPPDYQLQQFIPIWQFQISMFYIAIVFSLMAPFATTFLISSLQSSQLRPGVDKPLGDTGLKTRSRGYTETDS